ncbi:MAG: DUF1501 domain-containing protein [Planctomycetia bacterium]|nr:DUF1501 domain-containing protein [Planctomycetia bacterium]
MNVDDLAGLISRRELFSRSAAGIAGMALAALLCEDEARGAASEASTAAAGAGIPPGCHFRPRARSVIQLFQHGGPSHMDLFDPKPELNKRSGQPMPDSFTDLVQITKHGGLLGSPYKFAPAGRCGVEYSEIVPHIAGCADDIAVIRSMYTEHNNHEQALWHMHTGRIVAGRPTVGAWMSYALGSDNHNLPAYVVLRNDAALPVDGVRNWSSGFLPPEHQGVHFRHTGTPVLYLQPTTPVSDNVRRARAELLQSLNADHLARHREIASRLEARIASYEMAARMQLEAAGALDLSRETEETRKLYGFDNPKTESYGRRCLIARRLVERGVRFVQVFVQGQIWDTHDKNAERTKNCCDEIDRPSAALVQDLKRRGLLDECLVVWGGEFGRTPVSQGGDGRDHHKQGFSLWLAGGGIRGGQAYGTTDELGYYAVENRVMVADLHATILHLLGLDHHRLTYHLQGRDERLTDVYDAKVLERLID